MDERLSLTLQQIRELAKGEDMNQIEKLIEKFDAALEAEDRTSMRTISKEAIEMEKKYIPLIQGNKAISQQLNCETMIMTVGMQMEPIILSILCLKPRKIILLHTEGSRKVALNVEMDDCIKNMSIDITPLFITEYDASKNYQIIRDEALPRTSGVTVIDPTGGRKVMVASLALIAFYLRFPMVYVHSIEQAGVAFPFTERLRLIENPFDFFGDAELTLVEEQFNCHLYEAAYRTCQQLAKRVRHPAAHTKITMLMELIGIYRDWDAFIHSSVPEFGRPDPLLSERLAKVILDFCRLGFDKFLPENVDNNLNFLKSLDETWRNKKNISEEFRLVDVYASALRRGSEHQKKYDDAVGRLYRCLEMCSTIRLIQLGLQDTAKNPDYRAFGSKTGLSFEKLQDSFRRRKHRRLPTERLGLDDQMTLLDIAENKVGRIYYSMKKRKGNRDSLMDIRNRSILAHGTNPVIEEYWPAFRNKVETMIEETIGKDRFQELLTMAMHGAINII